MRAYAGTPFLAADGRIAGTLAIHSRRARVFSHADKLLLEAIAEELTMGLAGQGVGDVPRAATTLDSARRMMPLWIARSLTAGGTLPGALLREAADFSGPREVRIRMAEPG